MPVGLFNISNTLLQIITATNRVDILDPALLRSGCLDRKIEFPMPNVEAHARIMQIHSRKMNVQYKKVCTKKVCWFLFLPLITFYLQPLT